MTENPPGLVLALDDIKRISAFLWSIRDQPRARVWRDHGLWFYEVWRTTNGSPKRVAVGNRPLWVQAYQEALFAVREIVHHEEFERTRPRRPRFIE